MIRINQILTNMHIRNCRQFVTSTLLRKVKDSGERESPRMKQFHEKLQLQPMPRIGPGERFLDLVLVETDSTTGELIANSEKEPTKWGDWQNSGRVSDF